MESLRDFCHRFLRNFLAKDITTATLYDKYLTVAYAVRGHLTDEWIQTQGKYHRENVRRIYCLSIEYVFGKSLRKNIIKLGVEKEAVDVARYLGVDIEELYELEDDFNLGNGGRGSFAACLQDAMATQGVAGMGYGVRYDFSAFHQEIRNGNQYEKPCDWLHKAHPWEILRPEHACEVCFGGTVEPQPGYPEARVWKPAQKVVAMPYDFPVAGCRNGLVNSVRLWSARAFSAFPCDYVHHGDYLRACEEMTALGTVTKVLFPDEDVLRAFEQRLRQQYFFVAASMSDIVRRYRLHNNDILRFAEKNVIHLVGSSCALAIPELIRILVDIDHVPLAKAIEIAQQVFSYTTFAVAPEHLETWPVYMMEALFPRHLEIIYEINQKNLDFVRVNRKDLEPMIGAISLIEEGEVKRVRMSSLALLGSSHICGMSKSQTEAFTGKLFPQFFSLMPERFVTITGGIALRNWLLCVNPPLANVISQAIGESWIRRPAELSRLERLADDGAFLERLTSVKKAAKAHLTAAVKDRLGITLDHSALFDVQIKKIHLSQRQVLHALNILTRYIRVKEGAEVKQRRVHIFAGKASPSDHLAKQIIRLIHAVAEIVNGDKAVAEAMQLVFIPDYDTTWAERIVPAVDLSEQIPTPGREACGTSTMKMILNGAIPIVSYAGANLEIIERLGSENVVAFGADEKTLPPRHGYWPGEIIRNDSHLDAAFRLLERHVQAMPDGSSIFPLLATLRDSDEYYVLSDYADYVEKQDRIDELYGAADHSWARMTLRGIARIGWFSSDRVVEEYATMVWKMGAQ